LITCKNKRKRDRDREKSRRLAETNKNNEEHMEYLVVLLQLRSLNGTE